MEGGGALCHWGEDIGTRRVHCRFDELPGIKGSVCVNGLFRTYSLTILNIHRFRRAVRPAWRAP